MTDEQVAADEPKNAAPILTPGDPGGPMYTSGGRGGCLSGCGGIIAGVGVAVALVIGALALVVVLGINTVGGVFDGVTGLFRPPEPTYTTISTNLILERVQELSELTTSRYNFSNVVSTERDLPTLLQALYRDRLVIVMAGQIEAGIDLALLTEGDVILEDDTLTIRLPAPALQSCFINESESYVISRDTGVFASPAPNLDSAARQFAIREYREMALERGILDDANAQAVVAVRGTLTLLIDALPLETVPQVEIVTSPPDPDAPPPSTCAG